MNNINNKTVNWQTVPLGNLADFRNGINYTKDNFGKGIKVINVRDFQDHSIAAFDSLDEVEPTGIIKQEDLLKKNDIIFVRSNGNRELIGRSLFISDIKEQVTHSAFTIKLRFKSDKVYPRFYAYILRSSLMRQTLSAQGNGTNISNLNQRILSNLQVPFPPLPTQKKIAAILSAYDDLIENNTRRIKILEEMAQTLYHEWFVKFRFPGHEHTKMVDSELGLIPEGWEVKKLGDVVELAYGKALKASDRLGGEVAVYGSSGVVGYHNKLLVKAPGIIVGRKGNVGSVFWSEKDFYPIDTVYYVQTQVCLYYVYYNLQNQNFINNDAAVPGLNRNQAYSLPFILPSINLLNKFQDFVISIFQQLNNLKIKNSNLRQTRDLLLPKLISGEIDVEQLEITTEDIAA